MTTPLDRLRAALDGSYEIEREIGSGGMATVYLARDVKHDRQVAIKVLRPDLAAALGPDRFPREIRIVAQLQHPHILPLHDSGESQGFLYYVMPYVDGESLRTRIDREGQLPIADAIRILREVADALASAHGRGIMHRDIKPDNVMLSGRHAMVMDFGVARAVSAAGGNTLTTVGIAVGTPAYMSPEQATGEEHVDHRSDIYSLGVLAFELLAGRAPFTGKTAQSILSAHVLEQPPELGSLRASVPGALAQLVHRCLQKNPADRWQSAEEILHELEAMGTPSGGVTPTTTRPVSVVQPAAARSARPLMAAGVVLVLLAAVIGGWFALSGGNVPGTDRIAVLPITDISGSDAQFVEAMHDQLITALGQTAGISAAPRSATVAYRTAPKPVGEVAQELGVGAVLEGTVFRTGNRMRINVQLVDPLTIRQLWSQSYEIDVQDVLASQDAVVRQIADGVRQVVAAPAMD